MMYMYKVMHGLVCIPESSYIVQTSDSRTRGANKLIQHHTKIAIYKQSFFPRTIQEWNRLTIAVTNTTKLEEFKANLLSEMALQQTAETPLLDVYSFNCTFGFYMYKVILDFNSEAVASSSYNRSSFTIVTDS